MQNKIMENINFPMAETSLFMEPIHSNYLGNVHGGELMKLMDSTAGIAASKHAKGQVVTARVDEIVFHKAINIGDLVRCIAQVAYVRKHLDAGACQCHGLQAWRLFRLNYRAYCFLYNGPYGL